MSTPTHTCAFVGPRNAGKTVALKTIAHAPLGQRTVPTIGSAQHQIDELAVDCRLCSVHLLDTSGDPLYWVLLPMLTNFRQVMILFCSVSRFDETAFEIYRIARKDATRMRLAIVVGTHVDGPIDEAARSTVVEWAKANNLAYFDVDVFDEPCLLEVLMYAIRRLRELGVTE